MAEKTRFIKLDVEIDEPIADLIIALNQNHLPTRFCCCGHPTTTQIVLHTEQHNEYITVDNDNPHAYVSFHKFDLTEKFCMKIVNTLTCSVIKTVDDYYIKYAVKPEYSKFLTSVRIEHTDNDITFRVYYKPMNFEESRKYAIDCIQNILKEFIKEEFGYEE